MADQYKIAVKLRYGSPEQVIANLYADRQEAEAAAKLLTANYPKATFRLLRWVANCPPIRKP